VEYVLWVVNAVVVYALVDMWFDVRRLLKKERMIDIDLEVLQHAIDDANEMRRRVGCQMKRLDRIADKISQVLDERTHPQSVP
jgi:hypothetical protein